MKNIGENLVNILKAKSKRGILKYKKDGFSLIEVVIAITLMAILSGIAMTSYTKVQQDAKKNMDYTTAANIATAAQLADADGKADRKSTRLNSSHRSLSRMPSSA